MSATLCLLTSNADAVLARRARELARPQPAQDLDSAAARDSVHDVLFIRIAGEVVAVDVRHVLGAGHVDHLLPLPGTPAFILGVMLWEGRILAVNDLAMFLGLSATSHTGGPGPGQEGPGGRGQLVVGLHGPDPQAPQLELLVVVDELLGVGGLTKDALPGGAAWRPPPPAVGRLGQCRRALASPEQVRELRLACAAISVLDLPMLLADPELQPGAHS